MKLKSLDQLDQAEPQQQNEDSTPTLPVKCQ
jgi:hypothetical protein